MRTELERAIDDYVRRLGWSLQRIAPADRAEIVGEIRSHLVERTADDPDAIERELARLGSPYCLARRYLEEYELAGAVGGAAPGPLVVTILSRATRSARAAAAAFATLVLYAFGIAFAVIAVAKPILPDQVGAWNDPGGWRAGLVSAPGTTPDLLGIWIVPLALALAIGCYLAGTYLLRRTGRGLLRRA